MFGSTQLTLDSLQLLCWRLKLCWRCWVHTYRHRAQLSWTICPEWDNTIHFTSSTINTPALAFTQTRTFRWCCKGFLMEETDACLHLLVLFCWDLLSSMEHKWRNLEECSRCSFPFNETSEWRPEAVRLQKWQKAPIKWCYTHKVIMASEDLEYSA